jgi:hypothetical protein
MVDRTINGLVLLQHNTNTLLHLYSCSFSPQNNSINKKRQDISRYQKHGLKYWRHFKIYFFDKKQHLHAKHPVDFKQWADNGQYNENLLYYWNLNNYEDVALDVPKWHGNSTH